MTKQLKTSKKKKDITPEMVRTYLNDGLDGKHKIEIKSMIRNVGEYVAETNTVPTTNQHFTLNFSKWLLKHKKKELRNILG